MIFIERSLCSRLSATDTTCKSNHVLVAVDPKRKNFFEYKGVDIFKPNLSEAKEALNIIADEVSEKLLKEILFWKELLIRVNSLIK